MVGVGGGGEGGGGGGGGGRGGGRGEGGVVGRDRSDPPMISDVTSTT